MATKQDDRKVDGKWAGSVTEVISAPLDKIWEILGDFNGVQKNFPQIFLSCETTEGEKNKVGSLRVVVLPMPDGTPFEAKERLLVLDHEKHTLSYTIEDNLILTECKTLYTAEKHENDKTRVKWEFETKSSSMLTEEIFITQQKMGITTILTMVGQKLSQ